MLPTSHVDSSNLHGQHMQKQGMYNVSIVVSLSGADLLLLDGQYHRQHIDEHVHKVCG